MKAIISAEQHLINLVECHNRHNKLRRKHIADRNDKYEHHRLKRIVDSKKVAACIRTFYPGYKICWDQNTNIIGLLKSNSKYNRMSIYDMKYCDDIVMTFK